MIGLHWTGERGALPADRAFDIGAFEGLYRRTWPDVVRYAWLIARNHDDAKDVAAEAFRRALEAWSAGHGPHGEPMPWLLLITRRVAIDRQRRSRLIGWISIHGVREAADERESGAMARSEVWIWFEQLGRLLPESQREALLLRYGFDLSDEDGARVAATSVGNFRTLVSRGLSNLRRHPEVIER